MEHTRPFTLLDRRGGGRVLFFPFGETRPPPQNRRLPPGCPIKPTPKQRAPPPPQFPAARGHAARRRLLQRGERHLAERGPAGAARLGAGHVQGAAPRPRAGRAAGWSGWSGGWERADGWSRGPVEAAGRELPGRKWRSRDLGKHVAGHESHLIWRIRDCDRERPRWLDMNPHLRLFTKGFRRILLGAIDSPQL